MANLNEDEKIDFEYGKHQFDILLSFINHDGAKKLRDHEEGIQDNISLEGSETGEDFFESVKSLPGRRDKMLDSSPHDSYIAKMRTGLKKEFKVSTGREGESSDKPVILVRKIIVRNKNG